MRQIYVLWISLISFEAISQNFKEVPLKTEIKEVTVFLSGAQIFESGTASIPTGKSLLKIKNLSPFIDEKSIQVKAEGDFTILSVNHKFNYLGKLKKDAKVDSLNNLLEGIGATISKHGARLDVLKEKQSLLNENKNLGGQNSGPTIAGLKQAMEYYEFEISKIREEELVLAKSILLKKREQGWLEKELKEMNEQKTLPTSEVEIRIRAENHLTTKFSLTYMVSQAGWYPKYDIRVKNVKSPLELTYKAEVFQNTGVDWKEVKLRFSNGDPNKSGLVPDLRTWFLNLARYTYVDRSRYQNGISEAIGNVRGRVTTNEDCSALPGVNVVVKGTSIGTVTDSDGNYSLTLPNNASQLVFSFIGFTTHEVPITNLPEVNVQLQNDVTQLQEVVAAGYSDSGGREPIRIRGTSSIRRTERNLPVTTMIENQTTVEIEVETPYSIKSNGEKLQVDLKKHLIDASYEYFAIPKIDKDAFLVAKVINWDQYNLLEGEANLYFEDAYVGRSILEAKSMHDTLSISLGRDKNIVVGREKNGEFSKRKTIGSNMVETRAFKIIVRNKKSQLVKLTLFDQVPLSVSSDITVDPTELTHGQLDEKTGKVTWEFTIEPQKQKEIGIQYEVKYPRKEKVLLE